MEKTTDLIVIGAGPGGYTSAFLAADLGIKVMLIDESPRPGGVCLYRGCMPSKALLHVANVLTEARHATTWGVEFGEPKIDVNGLRKWKDNVVTKLTGGLAQLAEQRSVDYLQGVATLVDAHTVSVTKSSGAVETVRFDHAILATGSRPVLPEALATKSDRVLDSTSALDLSRIPENLLVIGGGYIGLELGSVYAALGSEITVVEMTSGLLPGVDRDLVNVLSRRFGKIAKAVYMDTQVVNLKPGKTGVEVVLDGPSIENRQHNFDMALVAVGRVPNSDTLGLDRTVVELDERGFVKVDSQRRTAEPSLFAIGDLVGEPMLAHKAFHEGRVAVEAITGLQTVFEPKAIPAVVFTDPEIAWCGLTETQAAKDQQLVSVARFPWAASGRALTLDRPDGLTKFIVDPNTEQVLGVGMVGSGAGELIAEGVVAIEMGATVSDLPLCIHPHPTLSETIFESAEVFLGRSTHVYRPKRK